MVEVVVRMLKRRDGLLAELHRHLSSLAQFLRPAQDLELATSLLLTDLQQTEAAVLRAQIRRSDIFTSTMFLRYLWNCCFISYHTLHFSY